jgi:predicted phage-related endonuclease
MEPTCLVHDQLDWMRASLDGLSFDGSIVLEIKCPWSTRDQSALREGRIPVHYYAQIQHQLEVSRAQEAHYWSFDGATGILVRAQPDREYIARLIEAEAAFWQRWWTTAGPNVPRTNSTWTPIPHGAPPL